MKIKFIKRSDYKYSATYIHDWLNIGILNPALHSALGQKQYKNTIYIYGR